MFDYIFLFTLMSTFCTFQMEDNPWNVEHFDEFLFYICPECNYFTKELEVLVDHAEDLHSDNYSKVKLQSKIKVPDKAIESPSKFTTTSVPETIFASPVKQSDLNQSTSVNSSSMIDPATGWVEIRAVPSARADLVANQVELAWLTRYPLPEKVILDRGNKFLAEFKELIEKDYGIQIKPITTRNPQANAVLERVHQTIGNIIRTFRVNEMVLDDENPWDGILAATMFALRATVHTTSQYTPAQLVFGRDSILMIGMVPTGK